MRFLDRTLRAVQLPPAVVARRLAYEATARMERVLAPLRARRFGTKALLRATKAADLELLWRRLATRPYPAHTEPVDRDVYQALCPGDGDRIMAAAESALAHRVSLLGSQSLALGPRIDWSKDYKTGVVWPRRFMRDIKYVNPDDASDVKVPWEISRLQWLMPAGQAYLLTGEERYAEGVRAVLDDWIDANPYAHSVNWSSTMEAALRILTWTWFFHVFSASRAWSDNTFMTRFLCALYLHGDFTERHFEFSDVNGNHCTADAAALVVAGLFFGAGRDATRWQEGGWKLLRDELPRQVYADGVDFEASVAYHRLVLELFLLPALHRRACGLDVPETYRDRLVAMARFTASYSRAGGLVPLWGDADDARALPLGGQQLNDHRYLAGLVGEAWGIPDLRDSFAGSRSEIFWLLGPDSAGKLPDTATPPHLPSSQDFPAGGFYVMRNDVDHVFIDCGPVGLAGRGGHGHNDCLAFEAALDGTHLISDCGTFVYTASFEERNRFRSTAFHNTPCVDGEEINRIRPDLPWSLQYDAKPELRSFQPGPDADRFCGAHSGYQRLAQPVTPVRTIVLSHHDHSLLVRDAFEGSGQHRIEIPLHLAPGVTAARTARAGRLQLETGGRSFSLDWGPPELWRLTIAQGRISPSYGIVIPTVRLLWSRDGDVDAVLTIRVAPAEAT